MSALCADCQRCADERDEAARKRDEALSLATGHLESAARINDQLRAVVEDRDRLTARVAELERSGVDLDGLRARIMQIIDDRDTPVLLGGVKAAIAAVFRDAGAKREGA